LFLLGGAVAGCPWVAGLGTAIFIAALARLGGAPRYACWALWLWLSGVLLYLVGVPPIIEGPGVEGLEGASWMLWGIWIVPLLLGPVAFLLSFRSWLSK
jgi:hypothetical protein